MKFMFYENKDLLVSRKSKVVSLNRGRPEGSVFNTYYTEVYERALLLSMGCSI